MKLAHAIFDLDGTLLDSQNIWDNLAVEYLSRFSIAIPANLQETLGKMSLSQSARYFQEELGVPHQPEEILTSFGEMIGAAYRHSLPLKEGAAEFLHRLHRQGTRLCIATASAPEAAHLALTRLGVRSCFAFILTCEQVGAAKDKPIIYLEAARRLGASPADTMVFEDSLFCIRTAKGAGFPVAGVEDKSHRRDQEAIRALADWYLPAYAEPYILPFLED